MVFNVCMCINSRIFTTVNFWLQSLNLLVIYSQDGKRVPDYVPDECDMVFVCELFEGEVYEYLHSRKFR